MLLLCVGYCVLRSNIEPGDVTVTASVSDLSLCLQVLRHCSEVNITLYRCAFRGKTRISSLDMAL